MLDATALVDWLPDSGCVGGATRGCAAPATDRVFAVPNGSGSPSGANHFQIALPSLRAQGQDVWFAPSIGQGQYVNLTEQATDLPANSAHRNVPISNSSTH